ncbi:hypothetical protein ATN84_25115 [Paramesorhizobium deserti]|uniref:Lipoprotein n=1 Tax=Paramesorhizobium deserti TaxID=1494590 RepID=A0A135HXI0_9HYPH|nr:hypothetical protein [Paramesorhizobium deserti]KXF77895.1 hypothetical protein ATN84_25115 [Paramesorhizobium deserti]
MFSKCGDGLNGAWKVLFAIVIASVVLTGCVSRDPRLLDALKGVRVTEVQVEATPDVGTGWPMMNGVTPQQQVAMIVQAVQRVASRDLKGYPGGPNPARLVITLQQADLASMPGRIIAGNDSWIVGTVRLEDARTGRLIAQNPRIQGSDKGIHGDGLGVIVAVAINAAISKSQEALVEKLAISFTRNVKTWLTPK